MSQMKVGIKIGKVQNPTRKQTPFNVFVDDSRGMVGYGLTYGENSYNGHPVSNCDLYDRGRFVIQAGKKNPSDEKFTDEFGRDYVILNVAVNKNVSSKDPEVKIRRPERGEKPTHKPFEGMIVSGGVTNWHLPSTPAAPGAYKIIVDDSGVWTKVRPRFSKIKDI
jgi:hypothetical protein